MDFDQLECIIAVERHRSFTRAAESINLSQSSLSQKIAKLEDELGIRLFERSTRIVYPSSAGLEFLKYANDIMTKSSDAKQMVQSYITAERGSISIGCNAIVSVYSIPSLIVSFKQDHPKLTVQFVDAENQKLIEMLKKSEIDVAFLNPVTQSSMLILSELIYDELALITSLKHPFAARGVIYLHEAQNENFILPSRTSAVYLDSIEACKKAGFEPNIVYESISLGTILDFVTKDLGVTLLSYKVAERHMTGGQAIVKLIPSVPRVISLAVLKDVRLSPSVEMFINYAKNWLISQE